MALGQEKKVLLSKIVDYNDAINLIEDQDLNVAPQEVKFNITSKLSAKTVYKLGRFKDQLTPCIKKIQKQQRALRDEHIAERDKDTGKAKRIDTVSYSEALENFLNNPELAETINIPKFSTKEFIKEEKFVVPIKFVSLFSDLLEDDE